MYEEHNSKTNRLYRIWINMKQRCNYPKDKRYKNYGGRGIKVCQEWESSFDSFREWALSNGYSDELSIDRIDVNGNYEPSNCRWATQKQQNYNRTNSLYYTYENETHTLYEWSKIYSINYQTLYERLNNRKLSFREAISKGNDNHRMITYNGKTQNLKAWSRELNIKYYTLVNRLRAGWTIKQAFTTPDLGCSWDRSKRRGE